MHSGIFFLLFFRRRRSGEKRSEVRLLPTRENGVRARKSVAIEKAVVNQRTEESESE